MRTNEETLDYIRSIHSVLIDWSNGYQLQRSFGNDQWEDTNQFQPGNENIEYRIAPAEVSLLPTIMINQKGYMKIEMSKKVDDDPNARYICTALHQPIQVASCNKRREYIGDNPDTIAIEAIAALNPFVVDQDEPRIFYPDNFHEMIFISNGTGCFREPVMMYAVTDVVNYVNQRTQESFDGFIVFLSRNRHSQPSFPQYAEYFEMVKDSAQVNELNDIYLNKKFHHDRVTAIPMIEYKAEYITFMLPKLDTTLHLII